VPAVRTTVPAPSKSRSKGGKATGPLADDDDLKDIEEILRKRGI